MQKTAHKTALIWASGWRSNSRSLINITLLIALALALSSALRCSADTVYMTQDAFIQDTFKEDVKPSVIWLDNALQQELSTILGHPYPQARLRYWRSGNTSLWVLDEIGKEYPITAGFVITGDEIKRAQVLIYRETRGMEIHSPGFLAQFNGSSLKNQDLSHKVDAIAGATLSTQAMIKMAKIALLLNQKTTATH